MSESEKLNLGTFALRSIETSWEKCRTLSLAELFRTGNYTTAALKGETDDWRTFASLGLIGKTTEALEGLARFDHEEARFYKGVIDWIAGDERTAKKHLETVDTEHARRLLGLMEKEKISVLSQFAWQEGHPNDFTAAAEKDGKFSIKNIGFDSRYIRNKACARIADLIPSDFAPDFYVSHMLEWHYLPMDLHELPCPVFGHTSDYDYCYHTSSSFLSAFDELIVSSGEEWEDVARLSSRPVSTFPKSFSVPDFLEDIPAGNRPYDVFFSGSTIEPIFCEKARLIHEVAAMDDVNIRMINGFLPMRDYYKALGEAKVSLTYYRRPGGTVTRGLDALSMGCAALVQPKSVLKLFLDESKGLFTYDFEKNDIREKVRGILNRWDDVAEGVRQGAAIIRREFDKTRVVSQYLRYLTFLAAKPDIKKCVVNSRPMIQKRLVFTRGLPCPQDVRKSIRECASEGFDRKGTQPMDHRAVIDAAREGVMEIADGFAGPEKGASPETQRLIAETLDMYRSGLDRFPDSLVLRFNYIRAALHFGFQGDMDHALDLAKDTVDREAHPWFITPEDDVFSWDFLRFYFDYKTCFDLMLIGLTEGKQPVSDLVRVIRASLHNYLSFYEQPLIHSGNAVTLNGEFPFYALRLAALLTASEKEKDRNEAALTLMELADHSYLFREAYGLLCRSHGDSKVMGSRRGEMLTKKMEKLNGQFTGKPGFEGYGQFVNVHVLSRDVNLETARAGEKDHVA